MSTFKTATANGDQIDWVPNVRHNTSMMNCYNARVVFVIPTGVRLAGPAEVGSTEVLFPVGSYNISNTTWYIGTLEPNKIITAPLEFIIDDIAQVDDQDRFVITATLESSCVESNSLNNVDQLIIEIKDPCSQVSLSIGTGDSSPSNINLSIG